MIIVKVFEYTITSTITNMPIKRFNVLFMSEDGEQKAESTYTNVTYDVLEEYIRLAIDESFPGEDYVICPSDELYIKVKYFTDDIMKLEKISKGDWIDLRAAKDMDIKAGDHVLIPLGIALELPKGYEAIVAPRSSTFKNWGLLQTNSIGIIDESYCGDNDQWFMSVYATRDTSISLNDRVCQFRIIKHQPMFSIEEVDSLGNKDRGGHGSTGTK